MKKLILLFSLFISTYSFSQIKEKQLLNNLAPQMGTQQKSNISAYGYGYDNHIQHNHNGYGNSEIFIEIHQRGYFTVELDNQIMSNPNGRFRFFEVYSGNNTLSIYRRGNLIYRSTISVPNSSRVMLDFSRNQLYLVQVLPINNCNNPFDYNPYDYNPFDGNPFDDNAFSYSSIMNPTEFLAFKTHLEDNAPFDKGKIKSINMQVSSGTKFTARQIKELLETFSFETYQLKEAKFLYKHCTDPKNYFNILNLFDFESSKKELQDFIYQENRF